MLRLPWLLHWVPEVARKDDIYYTFRIISGPAPSEQFVVQVAKWDDLEGGLEPVEVYTVKPDYEECSCPARISHCKHVRLSKELQTVERLRFPHHWKWNERLGWVKLNDMKEDF